MKEDKNLGPGQILREDLRFVHGVPKRARPEERKPQPLRVSHYQVEGNSLLLLVKNGFGNSGQIYNLAEAEEWFSQHHPQLIDEQGRIMLLELSPEALSAFLAHESKKRFAPAGGKVECGHLIDNPAAFFGYENLLRRGAAEESDSH
ncbi:MAG TPA: hypothetical protein V6C81_19365 [Planktothrix sp.]|jgi:hypothetical protein